MEILIRKPRHRRWYFALLAMVLSAAGLTSLDAVGQTAAATVNGVVKDPNGAAVVNAQVELTNVDTSVTRKTATNADGIYDFPSVVPGTYTMKASAPGFQSVSQPPVTLQLSQIATFDFQLKVGTTSETVTVSATAAALQTTSSELGTVVTTEDVDNLPLNTRNFTELLTITPGVVNLNTDQTNGGWNGHVIGLLTAPAINGARDRSNVFLLDGENDLNTLSGTYNYAPIVDAIQEFKTQGHNDLAEFGGAAGGLITVATKSGTNQYHGDLWEFLRNEVLDAQGYFNANKPPLRQNQFGAAAGGPVWIPKIYNGKNRTFFYAAYEGYRYASAQESGTNGPTPAEFNGDFSSLCESGFTSGICNDRDSQGRVIDQIYDPATTVLAGSSYTRSPFPNNMIPSSRFNPITQLYASIMPKGGSTYDSKGNNLYIPAQSWTNQHSGTIRADQNFGNNNQLMFRYSQFYQYGVSPSGFIGTGFDEVLGHNYIGHWSHEFRSTAFSDVYFGRNYGYSLIGTSHAGEDASFISQLKQAGVSSYWTVLNNSDYAPQFTFGYGEGLSGSQLQGSGLADNWQFGGSFSKIIGRHTLKAGVDIQTNNFISPIAYSGVSFGSLQTAALGADQGLGGNGWASALVGDPNGASYRNIYESAHGGWIDAFYVQDQWKVSPRLTVDLGFRNDMVFTPIYGTHHGGDGNYYTGEANPITGQYILNALPPTCSATQGAPCIPSSIYTASSTPATGMLPPHAIVSPTMRLINNSLADWGPRLGFAFRLNDKTTLRGGYTREYDEWATIVQLSQNFGGNWPAVNTIATSGQNGNLQTASEGDPLSLGSGGALVYPINDFSQVSQWMVDPNFKTPVFDEWNFGIERQLPGNIGLDANYVASNGRHEDWGPTMNTPSPGPGDQQSRRPFPYMQQQWFDQSVGNSRYNALQVAVTERPTHGVSFLVAYTLSQSNADGCNLGGSCNSSNPYNRKVDYGTSDLNERNVFSASFTAKSPYEKSPNRLVSTVAGGWGLNGIVQFSDGQPFTIVDNNDPENVGCCLQERVNVTGNPKMGSLTNTATGWQWFNPTAFTAPAPYTYGTEKVNQFKGQTRHDVDLSLVRDFHIGLGEERFFQFRADAFNLFNNVVFANPDTNIADYNTNPLYNKFGIISGAANIERQLQLALKFYY